MKKSEIAYHNYAEAKHWHQVQSNLFKPYVQSKQPRAIKTLIYNDIFTSLRCKKVQSLAQQFKELFSLVCYFFKLNEPSSALNCLKTAFI